MTVRSSIRVYLTAVTLLFLASYAAGVSAQDSWTLLGVLVGENEKDCFVECASAGDVNGDGFKDIIVGASQMLMDRGYAYVYFGGTEFDAIPDVKLFGEDSLPTGNSGFGSAVTSAGDVNDDGYDDILVVAQSFCGQGRAFLYLGGVDMDSIEDVVFEPHSGDIWMFATSISSAGDANDDGYDDVIIGSPEYTTAECQFCGRAYIYFGGDTMDEQFDVCIQGGSGDGLGSSVKAAGDINNDGYDDVLVGAPSDGQTRFEGRTSIYFGGDPMDTIPDVTFWGDSADFQHAGSRVSCAGDVNGDGYPDVMIVGNYENKRLRIFHGGPSMDTLPDVSLGGSHTICAAGDLNKDGFGDIMVTGTVFYGGDPMDTLADFNLPLGLCQGVYKVAGAGDINGDGFQEILISSLCDSTARGIAFVYSLGTTAISEDQETQVRRHFDLQQNYPNPFNSGTLIEYTVPVAKFASQVHTTLGIYNIRGQLVRTLVDEDKQPGTYHVGWDANDNRGEQVASGMYLYRLSVGAVTQERKMLLLK